jgi:two-component system nitrate/nitrite response regulator NarL
MSEPGITRRQSSIRDRQVRQPRAADTDRRQRRPRVAVVERHALVAQAIGLTLARSFEPIPVSLQSCTTTVAARDAILRSRADLAVLILSPGGTVDMLALVEQLSAHGVSVLVTGEAGNLRDAERYLYAGAASFWHRGGIAAVVRAVTREAERRAQHPSVVDTLRERPVHPRTGRTSVLDEHRRDLASLTPAESKILWAMMRGKGADDIAREHVVSVATVRTQIRHVLGKVGAKSQLQAVALAWSVGWTPGGDVAAPSAGTLRRDRRTST